MIGERLAEIRKDHGDTQQTLADKLQVSKFTVSNWEQEKSEPDHEMLIQICKLYFVSADYLLGRTGDVMTRDPDMQKACDVTGLRKESVERLQEICMTSVIWLILICLQERKTCLENASFSMQRSRQKK